MQSIPATASECLSSAANLAWVRGWLLGRQNSGPGCIPRTAKCVSIAVTRQIGVLVVPTQIVSPCLDMSVFDALIVINSFEVLSRESTAMSCGVTCMVESNDADAGKVNSPLRRNPKNPRQHAAQNIMFV